MDWIKKNLKWITIVLLFLFLIKMGQSCTRKMTIISIKKELTYEIDSIKKECSTIIESLNKEIIERDFLIKDLNNELKIAGVIASEAQKRAEAIQQTAQSVRSNTTIQIKGAEKDTIK